MKWSEVTKRKSKGGLSLGSLEKKNLGFLGKMVVEVRGGKWGSLAEIDCKYGEENLGLVTIDQVFGWLLPQLRMILM